MKLSYREGPPSCPPATGAQYPLTMHACVQSCMQPARNKRHISSRDWPESIWSQGQGDRCPEGTTVKRGTLGISLRFTACQVRFPPSPPPLPLPSPRPVSSPLPSPAAPWIPRCAETASECLQTLFQTSEDAAHEGTTHQIVAFCLHCYQRLP